MTPSTPLFLLLAAVVCSVRAVSNWPIIAPAAGDDVPTNQPYTIRWTNQTEGPVSITLMYTDADEIVLTSSTENTGSYEWTPVSVLAGDTDYFLKICDVNLDGSECAYTSNGRFHIVSSPTTSTTITTTPIPTTITIVPTLTTATSTSTTTTPPRTTTILTMTTPRPSEDNNNASSGLGTASVVGLSVGTTLGTLFLAAVAFILYKKSKKSKAAKQASAPGSGPGPHDAGEHPSEYYHPGAACPGGEGYSPQQHDQQYLAQGYPVQQKQHHPLELDSRAVVPEMGDHRR
ncbi:hypothetical protein F4824DRAFT_498185 [Ustulina deusta]|nr:hypothetical protein F4824DRAFT_498185 [Ustulina deusta]